MKPKKTPSKSRQLKKNVQRVVPKTENNPPQFPRGSKTIRLPCDKSEYTQISNDPRCFKMYLNEQLKAHPELFPKAMLAGYVLDGYTALSWLATQMMLKKRYFYNVLAFPIGH